MRRVVGMLLGLLVSCGAPFEEGGNAKRMVDSSVAGGCQHFAPGTFASTFRRGSFEVGMCEVTLHPGGAAAMTCAEAATRLHAGRWRVVGDSIEVRLAHRVGAAAYYCGSEDGEPQRACITRIRRDFRDRYGKSEIDLLEEIRLFQIAGGALSFQMTGADPLPIRGKAAYRTSALPWRGIAACVRPI